MRPVFHFVACLLLASGCAERAAAPRPSDSSVARIAPAVGSTPVAPLAQPAGLELGPERVFDGKRLVLDDGTVLTRQQDRYEVSSKDGSRYSYIVAGDAEVIDSAWLFRRDLDGVARISRWQPRTVDVTPNTRNHDIVLRFGDRLKFEDWTITWTGVVDGTSAQSGKRVMVLESKFQDRVTDAWQYDGAMPGTHDFPREMFRAMSHLGVDVVTAHFDRDAVRSTLVVRVRETDRATDAAWDAALAPGLYKLPDGTRVLFEKSTLCGMGTVCVCRDTFAAVVDERGKQTTVALTDGMTSTSGMRTFRLNDGRLVVRPR